MAEATKELGYKVNLLEAANNQAEINQLKYSLQIKAGDHVKGKGGQINFDSLPLMDLILRYIDSDPKALQEILEHAGVSLDNPVIKNSLIAYLELQGKDEGEILQALNSAGISVTAAEIAGNELDIDVSTQGHLFDTSAAIDIGGLVAALFGNKKSGEKGGVVTTKTDKDGNNVGVTQEGSLFGFLANSLASLLSVENEEELDDLQEELEGSGLLHGEDVAEVREGGEKITVNDKMDENSKELIEQHGSKGVKIAKGLNQIVPGSEKSRFSQFENVLQELASKARDSGMGKSFVERVQASSEKQFDKNPNTTWADRITAERQAAKQEAQNQGQSK